MLSILASLILAPMQAAAPPQASPPLTRQQLFDRATTAADAGKCADAVRDFTAIEANKTRKSSAGVAAAIAVRKGMCLIRLGRAEEGEASLRAGLVVLAPLGAVHAGDVRNGHLMLGRLAMSRYDYATADQEVGRALALSPGDARVEPLLVLASITMFDKGPRALAYADEALALMQAGATTSKGALAAVRTARGRVLLNQGAHQAGYDDLREALKLQGGLGLKVGVADIVTRSDLAIAALLVEDQENARKYLAYTGAGRMKDTAFASAISMQTPLCGGGAGLKPDDRTIVEFRIADDGSVAQATPIWSTGGRFAALEFARAVSGWSWQPESAVAIPLIHRYATRVELRCSTVGERPSLISVLEADIDAWLKSRGLAPFEGEDSAVRSAALARAALEGAGAAPADPARLAPLIALGRNPVVPEKERAGHLEAARRIAVAINAPAAVHALIGLETLSAGYLEAIRPGAWRDGLRKLLADPLIAADPHSAGTLRVLIARPGYRGSPPGDADALLAAVAADARLPADDPLRVAALLEQASRAAAAGQIESARAAFDKTGLTEQQCALVGIAPVMKKSGGSSSDYPMEAMRWGFEGWSRVEFDILADGRTAGQRAIIAYPPFVFNDAAAGILRDARYQASYRPSGGSACSGKQQQVVFKLPR